MQLTTNPAFPNIVCPVDQLPLQARDRSLACASGHSFTIEDGIPRIARPNVRYVDAFGEQWNRYRLTQLDSYTGTTITRDRLRRCLGDVLWARLDGSEPTQVLESGCGAGRFTEVLLSLRGARVTSVDLSSAVTANVVTCPQSDRHRVLQCDITALPFPPAQYDVVICLGVIQHTPDPEQTMTALYRQVKPGGWLVIDHYAPELSYYTKVAFLLLRPILKRLPPRQGTAVTERLTRIFFPLHRLVRHRTWMQNVLSRISPLLTYYHVHPELDDRLQYEWALLDTHDALTDYYKRVRSQSQIRRFLTSLGGQDIWVAKGGNGVEARCRKPV